MATHEPLPRSLDVAEAQQALAEVVTTVARNGERIVVEQQGIPVAALVSMQDLARLARLDAEREERFKVFDRIGAAFAHETEEESERLAALALAEVRDEMRLEREAQNKP